MHELRDLDELLMHHIPLLPEVITQVGNFDLIIRVHCFVSYLWFFAVSALMSNWFKKSANRFLQMTVKLNITPFPSSNKYSFLDY